MGCCWSSSGSRSGPRGASAPRGTGNRINAPTISTTPICCVRGTNAARRPARGARRWSRERGRSTGRGC
eukprot:5094983-Prymnesium_polylepis.1